MGAFITYSASDIGNVRMENEDTIGVLVNTDTKLNAALGVVCDGVGGLDEGKYASETTFNRFVQWFQYEFPQIAEEDEFEEVLKNRWNKLITTQNQSLYKYASSNNCRLGTTLTAILLFKEKYYTMQVGDSRAYEITEDCLRQLTEDQSLIAMRIRKGEITKEQAKFEAGHNVLLQSVGYAKHIAPEFKSGDVQKNALYLICSDGFYHCVNDRELTDGLKRENNSEQIKCRLDSFIELVKQRGEKDNISAACIRYDENSFY